MRRIFVLVLTALFAAVCVSVAIGQARADTRVCQLWASKPYRHCIRYAPSPTTTTSTTTTTTTLPPTTTAPMDITVCDLGSDFRQMSYDDALSYYAYSANRDQVNLEASIVAYVCASVDPALAAAGQAVVDCFAASDWYFGQCAQVPTDPIGLFAAALEPTPIEPDGDPTTTTVDISLIDALCRENGPGRVAAINDVYAYETTWDQPEADQVTADAGMFILACATYPGTDTLRYDAQVLVTCLNGRAGLLPHFQACYLPGNEINRYLTDLLTSSR